MNKRLKKCIWNKKIRCRMPKKKIIFETCAMHPACDAKSQAGCMTHIPKCDVNTGYSKIFHQHAYRNWGIYSKWQVKTNTAGKHILEKIFHECNLRRTERKKKQSSRHSQIQKRRTNRDNNLKRKEMLNKRK